MKPAGAVLRRTDYTIADIPQATARQLVEAHHYARGGPNTGVFRHGLFHRDDPETALGVAWWLPPTRVAAESVAGDEWRRVLSLTRLVIAPEVPANAATFLLAASTRIIRRDDRWAALVTYADEGQGHAGTIYRAAGWEYVGTSRGDAVWTDRDGRQVSRKSASKSRTRAEMLALGYTSSGPTRKHKFIRRLTSTIG